MRQTLHWLSRSRKFSSVRDACPSSWLFHLNIQPNWFNWNGTEPSAGRNIIMKSILFMESIWQLYDKVLWRERNGWDHVKALKNHRDNKNTSVAADNILRELFNVNSSALDEITAINHFDLILMQLIHQFGAECLTDSSALMRGCWVSCWYLHLCVCV